VGGASIWIRGYKHRTDARHDLRCSAQIKSFNDHAALGLNSSRQERTSAEAFFNFEIFDFPDFRFWKFGIFLDFFEIARRGGAPRGNGEQLRPIRTKRSDYRGRSFLARPVHFDHPSLSAYC
jgi:hypothetical protein